MTLTELTPRRDRSTKGAQAPPVRGRESGGVPVALGAERAVLGAVLFHEDALDSAAEDLCPEDFHSPAHMAIFAACLHLRAQGFSVDPTAVAARLSDTGELDSVGGHRALMALVAAAPTADPRVHVARVIETAARRRLLAVALEVQRMATDPSVTAPDALLAASTRVNEVDLPEMTERAVHDVSSFVNATDDDYAWVIEGLMEIHERAMVVAPEGFGKALALDTPIRIPNGWSTQGALKVGDLVLDDDWRPTEVVAISPIWNGRPCWRLGFSDGSEVVCDTAHEWPVSLDGGQVAPVETEAVAEALLDRRVVCIGEVKVEEAVRVSPVPVRCIEVASPDHLYRAGVGAVPTHNSTLLRQIALMASQGIHPFEVVPIPPVRCLLIDLENPERLARRKLRGILNEVIRHVGTDHFDPSRCMVWAHQPGLDIVNNRADHMRLANAVRQSQAQLILIGPLYKVYRGDPRDEEPAKAASAVLDDICSRYKAALIIETHAPYGARGKDLRPYGASLWSRWPDYGLGMDPSDEGRAAEVVAFRGNRDERAWPTRLERGHPWPWVVPASDTSAGPTGPVDEF
ncbi:MAG: DnaB-like helicase N-terminal domain-containing protein [Acidimicrobiales bacterium]